MGREMGTANLTSNGEVDGAIHGEAFGYGKPDDQRRGGRRDPWEGRRPSKDTVQRSTRVGSDRGDVRCDSSPASPVMVQLLVALGTRHVPTV